MPEAKDSRPLGSDEDGSYQKPAQKISRLCTFHRFKFLSVLSKKRKKCQKNLKISEALN